MKLIEQIDADIKSAIISGDKYKRDILRVLKGEVSRGKLKSSDYTNDDFIRVTKKMIENLKIINDAEASKEISILESYIPKQMNESEIQNAVEEIILAVGYSGPKDMGKIMSSFNSKYKGLADGKTVADIVKKTINAIC